MVAWTKRDWRNMFSLGAWLPMTMSIPQDRAIAITIDDGPSAATTAALLDLLKAHGATATFFFSGRRAEQNAELVQRTVREGHQVFSHGYEHIHLGSENAEHIVDEMDRAEAIFRRFRPTPSPYFLRMPYGSGHGSSRMHHVLRSWRPDCALVHWQCSLQDWLLADDCATEQELEARCEDVVNTVLDDRRVSGSILLLHEDPFDVDAPLAAKIAPVLLGRLLAAARSRGLVTAPVSVPASQPLVWRYIRRVGVA